MSLVCDFPRFAGDALGRATTLHNREDRASIEGEWQRGVNRKNQIERNQVEGIKQDHNRPPSQKPLSLSIPAFQQLQSRRTSSLSITQCPEHRPYSLSYDRYFVASVWELHVSHSSVVSKTSVPALLNFTYYYQDEVNGGMKKRRERKKPRSHPIAQIVTPLMSNTPGKEVRLYRSPTLLLRWQADILKSKRGDRQSPTTAIWGPFIFLVCS